MWFIQDTHMGGSVPSTWVILLCFSLGHWQRAGSEIEQPIFVIPTSQVVVLPIMPQCWLPEC